MPAATTTSADVRGTREDASMTASEQEARDEADRRWPSPNSGLYEGLSLGFVLGAQWQASRSRDERGFTVSDVDPAGDA